MLRSETGRGESGAEAAHPDLATAYLAQLGEGSRRTMREALSKMAHWLSDDRYDLHTLPWHRLRIEHTASLHARLKDSLAPATANKHLAALRGVLKQAVQFELLSPVAYQRAIDLPPVRGTSPRNPNRLGALELEKLARACADDTSPAGARDEALLALLYGASLRRSEAVALELADYELTTGLLLIRGAAGSSVRRFVATGATQRALERWLVIRGREPGPIFNPVNKAGRIDRRRLSQQAIYIACQKRASEAGLPRTSPEDLRRANASRGRRSRVVSSELRGSVSPR
jgi:integrase